MESVGGGGGGTGRAGVGGHSIGRGGGAAGTHAKILNDLVLKLDGKGSVEERLEELLGHTPLQVLGGFVLGILVCTAMYL